MIAAVGPSDDSVEQTLNTLRYAATVHDLSSTVAPTPTLQLMPPPPRRGRRALVLQAALERTHPPLYSAVLRRHSLLSQSLSYSRCSRDAAPPETLRSPRLPAPRLASYPSRPPLPPRAPPADTPARGGSAKPTPRRRTMGGRTGLPPPTPVAANLSATSRIPSGVASGLSRSSPASPVGSRP